MKRTLTKPFFKAIALTEQVSLMIRSKLLKVFLTLMCGIISLTLGSVCVLAALLLPQWATFCLLSLVIAVCGTMIGVYSWLSYQAEPSSLSEATWIFPASATFSMALVTLMSLGSGAALITLILLCVVASLSMYMAGTIIIQSQKIEQLNGTGISPRITGYETVIQV